MNLFKHISLILILIVAFSLSSKAANNVYVDISIPDKIEAGQSFDLKISIHKEKISGFAKLEIYLPIGLTAKINSISGASCIIKNDFVKIIWIDLPQSESFEFTIPIMVDSRISGYKEIFGTFFYVEKKERKKQLIGVTSLNVNNSLSKDNKNIISENKISSNNILPDKNNFNNNYFRVQVAAFKKKLSNDIIIEFYPDKTYIFEEKVDDYFKYTIGNFKSKEDADLFRVKCGYTGAFIVKYENGVRK